MILVQRVIGMARTVRNAASPDPETRTRRGMNQAHEFDHELAREGLRHWNEAFGLALTITRDRSRAEDICQDALVRLATARRPVDRSKSLRPLLLRIVRNLGIDQARRSTPEPLDAHEAAGPASVAPGPLDAATRREEITIVRAALSELPPAWRSMLYLRDGLDLSYSEIAGVESSTEDVVRVTLHRARRRIRSRLEARFAKGTDT